MRWRARGEPRQAAIRGVEQVAFLHAKYGPEILIDTAWVREMPTFLRAGPHALDFHDILLVTKGRGTYTLDEHSHRVRPGTVFFTIPGQVRRWKTTDLDGLSLFFPGAFLEEFFQDPHFLDRLPYFHAPAGAAALRLPPRRADDLKRRLLSMRREFHRLRLDSAHLLRARLYEILVTLARDYASAHGTAAARSANRTALRFREMVEAMASSRHRVAAYAGDLGVSPGHLNALCRRHLGRSAKGVIQDRLAVEARRALLYTDETAARVGYALGFEDPSYFTRFFRRITGQSPSAFRKGAAGGGGAGGRDRATAARKGGRGRTP